MGSLYECLREARLDKFYPTLRANGFASAESLTELTPDDISALGLTSSDEQRRLYELVDIVRSVYEVDIDDLPNVSEATAYSVSMPINRNSQQNKPARKRNRSPTYYVPLRRSETLREAQSQRSRPTVRRHVSMSETGRPGARHERREAAAYNVSDSDTSNDDGNSDSSGPSDYEPATKHVNRAAATPPRIRKVAPVERVKHTAGYNYGVPRNRVKQKTFQTREDVNDKIRVCVRKRPRNKREIRGADDDVVVVERSDTITINEPKQAVDLRPYTLQHEFCFDEVFHEGCGNEEVFERAAKPLIDCVFQGGSATCFAYGQTGAGKTHTMLGSREHPGLYLLAAQEIFSITQSQQYGAGLKVWVSFFEIYCGQLFDLLNKRNRLHAREDGSHRVCIAGLTETQVTDVPSIMQVLEYGNQVRSKGATGVNPDSSRSHAVLQVEVRTPADKRLGRMSFIDLAGSERASDVTDTDRQTRMEGAEINQSLLALKECIRSIDQDSRHTPFRQSKLTHILKDSFIGNSRTCMIANVSPTYTACENTLNTLRYADRVKELRKTAALRASKAIVQTVLNVPVVTPPSLFHPSNISCESTPVRPRMSRKHAERRSPPPVDLPDPAETPIRGNFPGQRKAKRDSKQRHSATGVSLQRSRSAVARGSVPVTPSTPVIHRERLDPLARSSSDSNPLSDTCNVSVKDTLAFQPKVVRHEPLARSDETEEDVPVEELDDVDQELNDLNKSGGRSESVEVTHLRTPAAGDFTSRSQSCQTQIPGSSPRTSMNVPEIDGAMFQNSVNGGGFASFSMQAYQRKPLVLRPRPTDFEDEEADSKGRYSPERDDLDDLLFGPPEPAQAERPYEALTRHLDRLEGLPQTRETIASEMVSARGMVPEAITPRRPDLCVPQASPAKSSDLTSFSRSENMKLRGAPTPDLNPDERDPVRLQAANSPIGIESNDDIQAGLFGEEFFPRHNPESDLSRLQEPSSLLNDSGRPSKRDRTDPLLARHKARQNMPNPSEFLRHLTKQAWSKSTAPSPVIANIPLPVLPNCTPVTQSTVSETEAQKQPDSLSDHETDLKRAHSVGSLRSQGSPSPSTLDSPGHKTSDGSGPGSMSPVDMRRPASEARQRRRSRSSSRDRDQRKPAVLTPPDASKCSNQPASTDMGADRNVLSLAEPDELPKVGGSDQAEAAGESSSYVSEGVNLPASGDFLYPSLVLHPLPSSPNLPNFSATPAEVRMQNMEANAASQIQKPIVVSAMSAEASRTSRSSPVDGAPVTRNKAITTEKLSTFSPGGSFAPIHPQPVTNDLSKQDTTKTLTREVLPTQNRSVSLSMSSSTSGSILRATSNLQRLAIVGVPQDEAAAKSHIIAAHEEQLAAITSLCKQEMKLLLSFRAGQKDTEEYVKRMGDILTLKMKTVTLLQDQIEALNPARGRQRQPPNQNQL